MNGLARAVGIGAVMGMLAAPPASAQAVPPGGDSLVLRVDGMVCSLCAYGVERRLRGLGGVDRVSVDLEHHRVVVTLRPGGTIADSVLHREVTRAGFALREITRHSRTPGPSAGGRP